MAMDFPMEVFPVPGEPPKQRIRLLNRSPLLAQDFFKLRTAKCSTILSLTLTKP